MSDDYGRDYEPRHLDPEPPAEPTSWLTARRRAAIYSLAVAIGALLVAYGLVTSEQWAPIAGVIEQTLVLLAVVLPHTDEASTR